MTLTKKTKLCWNCEGVVDRNAENCVYCGVYLHPEEDEDESHDVEDNTSPLYTPEENEESDKHEHKPHYQAQEEDEKILYEEIYAAETKKEKDSDDIKGVILPLLFLLGGSIFLLFGLILYFFSSNGVFVLKWNANYWFVYILLSIPLLYIGWRTLQYFEENKEKPNSKP